jgi:hypothetical protein
MIAGIPKELKGSSRKPGDELYPHLLIHIPGIEGGDEIRDRRER